MPKKPNKAKKLKGEGSAALPKGTVKNVSGGDKIAHNPKGNKSGGKKY